MIQFDSYFSKGLKPPTSFGNGRVPSGEKKIQKNKPGPKIALVPRILSCFSCQESTASNSAALDLLSMARDRLNKVQIRAALEMAARIHLGMVCLSLPEPTYISPWK